MLHWPTWLPANSPALFFIFLSPGLIVLLQDIPSVALSALRKLVSLMPFAPVSPAQPHSSPEEGCSFSCKFMPPALIQLGILQVQLCFVFSNSSRSMATLDDCTVSHADVTFSTLPSATLSLGLSFPALFSP